MTPENRESLNRSLLELGESARFPAGRLESLADAIRALGSAPSAAGQDHLLLAELQQLATDRRAHGERWEMPEHLSACPLCLQAFEVILQDPPAVSDGAVRRYRDLFPRMPIRRRLVRYALAASILLAIGLAFAFSRGGTTAQVTGGSLVYEGGKPLAAGAKIAEGAVLVAKEDARTTFKDGSVVAIARDTRVSFHESLMGETTVDLRDGSVEASVSPQKQGKAFRVQTPLGEVRVVGTRFKVTYRREPVTIYENRAQGAAPDRQANYVGAVTVQVFEGKVLVRNRHQQEALVVAGSRAVMRENQPTIDVSVE